MARTQAQLLNVYGPTETTILASSWRCATTNHTATPIGRPVDHTQIFIVDQNLKLLPLGVVGEIVIGGPCVAKGYVLQAVLSKSVFVRNPFSGAQADMLYRTGDLGFIATDGLLYFSGRIDKQVKISGYRIEPEEIEAALIQHPKVKLAAVDVFTKSETKYLAAYVESNFENAAALIKELSVFLRSRLPDYMQPKVITLLDTLPVTTTGKIAYGQLPAPVFPIPKQSGRQARTYFESQILEIWKQLLRNDALTIDDNFFEQDTDSLTALNLIVNIEKLTGQRHSIAFLTAFPTVALQVENLTQAQFHLPLLSTLSKQVTETHFYLAVSGIGDQLRFQALAEALGNSCTLHMLYPAGADSHTSITRMAEFYANAIMNAKQARFYLGGFSIGGITALETARILAQKGFSPHKLILLDSVYPRWPLQSPWLFKFLQWLSGKTLMNKISVNERKLQIMLTDPGIICQLAGLYQHSILPFQGTTELIISEQMNRLMPWQYTDWCKLFGAKITRHSVSGLHGAIFRPKNILELAAAIKSALKP